MATRIAKLRGLQRDLVTVTYVQVPLFDQETPRAHLTDRLHDATRDVLDSGRFILGEQVSAFEDEFASYLGAKHAVGVANGTDAITLALRALGVGPGDDVVVPSFSFYASAEAIVPTGARPVFCDIDLETFCVTADTVKAALTPKTKAVIAVHLFGNVAPVSEIAALGVPVLEDAAQAAGSICEQGKAGALGTISTFSFFPSKNLGGFGDGGAVVTDDEQLAEEVETLRRHGSKDKKTFTAIGYNSRLDELQAALLRVQLTEIDNWAAGRRNAGQLYAQAGLGELVKLPVAVAGSEPAWHLYVIKTESADELAAELKQREIGAASFYQTPIHRQPAMREFREGDLPATDRAAATNLAIPISPTLNQQQVDAVVAAISDARLD